VNTDTKIQTKKQGALAWEFYARGGIPDDSFFWTAARDTVQKILKDAAGIKPAASLFLRLHYPFFNSAVQKVLKERHPERSNKEFEVPQWYAVEAYLIAEQYSLVHHDNCRLKNLNLIQDVAQDYFIIDLKWFLQLLTAISNAFEQMRGGVVTGKKITSRLQAWNNQYSQVDATPDRWMAGTDYLKKAKGQKASPLNSVRVSAAKENKKRVAIFHFWRPCWQEELKRLNSLLGSNPSA